MATLTLRVPSVRPTVAPDARRLSSGVRPLSSAGAAVPDARAGPGWRPAPVGRGAVAEEDEVRAPHGNVERVPDPADRRAKLARSTARGSEVYAIARRGKGVP